MKWVFRLVLWYFAFAGAKAIVSLNLTYGAPVKAVAAAFLLAGVLSTLQPRQAALWAGLAGGAAVLGELVRAYVYPAFAMAMPGRFAFVLVLPLAVAIAGAAAGSAVPSPPGVLGGGGVWPLAGA